MMTKGGKGKKCPKTDDIVYECVNNFIFNCWNYFYLIYFSGKKQSKFQKKNTKILRAAQSFHLIRVNHFMINSGHNSRTSKNPKITNVHTPH